MPLPNSGAADHSGQAMLGRVDEMTINAQRRTGWILLCLPFVISLATSAAVSVCGARRITTLNVAHVYVQSFEGSCSRISVTHVKRTWSPGCSQSPPAPETCATQEGDPMPSARWVLGIIATIAVVAGLWRRSLASITVDYGARTVRVDAADEVALFPFDDRPAVTKDKRRFVVQTATGKSITIGKSPEPRELAVLRECLASLPKA